MTTYVPFTPSATVAPFQFQAPLDGNVYNIVITWNVFGARWYVNCYAIDGTWIFTRALVGSPIGINIETASWSQGIATVTLGSPLPYRIGNTVKLTIVGSSPDTWNVPVLALVTGPTTFTAPMSANPGQMGRLGVVNQDISLTDGYFSSTLVYRAGNLTFEIAP